MAAGAVSVKIDVQRKQAKVPPSGSLHFKGGRQTWNKIRSVKYTAGMNMLSARKKNPPDNGRKCVGGGLCNFC